MTGHSDDVTRVAFSGNGAQVTHSHTHTLTHSHTHHTLTHSHTHTLTHSHTHTLEGTSSRI